MESCLRMNHNGGTLLNTGDHNHCGSMRVKTPTAAKQSPNPVWYEGWQIQRPGSLGVPPWVRIQSLQNATTHRTASIIDIDSKQVHIIPTQDIPTPSEGPRICEGQHPAGGKPWKMRIACSMSPTISLAIITHQDQCAWFRAARYLPTIGPNGYVSTTMLV